jgi:hypothetical protein
MYSILTTVNWTEQFGNQLAEWEIWDDKNFAKWLLRESNPTQKTEIVLSQKAKPALAMYAYLIALYLV